MRSLKTLKCLLALGMICSTSSLVVKAEDTGVPTETEPETGTEGTEETIPWEELKTVEGVDEETGGAEEVSEGSEETTEDTPETGYEENAVINIANSEALAEAIKNQADGQTWNLTGTDYVLTVKMLSSYSNIQINSNGNLVLPIVADNLTINGNGATVTSSYVPDAQSGGNWYNQNFITVSGDNVTIDNLQIKPNSNKYYDTCNKAIEVFGGNNFTLSNSEILPLTDSDNSEFSGSIYFSDNASGTIQNVELSAWISGTNASELTVDNVTFDFTNNTYAGYSSELYGYAWNPGVSGNNVTVKSMTIVVDDKTNLPEQVAKDIRSNTTIELASNITLDKGLYIVCEAENKLENIVIKGNGNTITASEDFTTNEYGQINLVKFENVDNGAIENVTLQTTDKVKHALDVYASNLEIDDVVLDHTNGQPGAPLIVNQSVVTLNGNTDLITGTKSWYAFNVDDNGNAGSAKLTVNSYDVTLSGPKAVGFVEPGTDAATAIGGQVVIDSNGNVTIAEEPYIPPYRPSRPVVSDDDSIDINGITVDSEDEVDVEEVSTDRDVRDALGRDNIITTIQVEEADEPVEVTVEAGRDYKDETVYVVQKNADDELVLVAVVEADSRGDIVFVTESAEKLTLTTYLPEGFINNVDGNTYYINEDSEMVYGWLELEDGWYFFDYETGFQQKGRWVAEYSDWYCLDANGRMFTSAWIARDSKLDVWYYVNENGLMLTNTTTPDGFYVDAEGIWRA